ncbi:MAG: RyR domain-containing protein [Marinilabiliales bacterium]|nr:RyR domain-containing protein [Marinilabiliales bacterium]
MISPPRYSTPILTAHAHIPTKLLSIGYRIRPVNKGFKPLTLHLDDEEIETMARVEHLRWSWEKRLNGWTYGKVKDGKRKIHPDLIPYDELGEAEKAKDRSL